MRWSGRRGGKEVEEDFCGCGWRSGAQNSFLMAVEMRFEFKFSRFFLFFFFLTCYYSLEVSAKEFHLSLKLYLSKYNYDCIGFDY